MRKRLLSVGGGCCFVVSMFILAGCAPTDNDQWDGESTATPLDRMSDFSTIEADREVIVHCGNSMRLAMEQIAAEFQKRHNIAVVFNYGGSAELLPLIELGGEGDLYICHDPYAEKLEEMGVLVDYRVIGHLKPVLLVKRGNPERISRLADLGARGDLRVATVDPRYATAGQMLEQVLEREDWGQAVKDNIVVESRGHSDAAMALLTGHVDAAVVWNFIAALYSEQLEEVDTGVDFDRDIRVTLTRLTTSTNHQEAEKFMDFATTTDFARNVFSYYGYLEAGTE